MTLILRGISMWLRPIFLSEILRLQTLDMPQAGRLPTASQQRLFTITSSWKSLDSVHEGGIVAFIASQGSDECFASPLCMEMMRRADLGRSVPSAQQHVLQTMQGLTLGADLIILQKHTNKKALSADEEFFIQSIVDRETKSPNNKYFPEFPQNVICMEAKVGTDQYGKPGYNLQA